MTETVQIIGSRGAGGAEGFYCRLSNALLDAGHPTHAMLPASSVLNRQLDAAVPRVNVSMRGVWDLLASYQIKRWIQTNRPVIAQTWMGRATRLTRLSPTGPTVHVARLGGFYDVRSYAHAHAWVGNTRGICDYLICEGLPQSKVFYIGNFVDTVEPWSAQARAQQRERLGFAPDDVVLLTTGRFHANKGLPDLLEAFAKLPEDVNGRRTRLLLVGDGPLRAELQAHSVDLDIDARVVWTGWQYNTRPYYQAADVFVCPSRHEPLGNIVLEAWSHRLPVVSTRSQGPLELITDSEDGRLVAVQAPDELASELSALLNCSPAERDALAAAGEQKVQASFSREVIVDAYLSLYEELANQRG